MISPTAADACYQSLAHHSKSFRLASRLLPASCRTDAAVLYAWCRRADDAIDLSSREEGRGHLDRLRAELDEVYAGRPKDDLVLSALGEIAERRQIPKAYPEELLRGLEMDIRQSNYQTLDELLGYCFRVAGTVGLMMCHVMGVSNPLALRQAAHLGIAMQLTNIARDVREDWCRGRLYVPLDWLGTTPEQARRWANESTTSLPAAWRRPLAHAVQMLLAKADDYYRSADLAIGSLSFRCALSVRTARLVYAAIGSRLAARRYDVFAPRAFVPWPARLLLAARSLGRGLLELPRRMLRPFVPAAIDQVLRFPDDVLPI